MIAGDDMTKGVMKAWEIEAGKMRGRELTKEEAAALNEQMLRGTLNPEMDKRKRKNVIRSAIDGVRPGKKQRAG
jgi:DNA-binding transcriptional regulator/RsmH inhibitor MraZ